MAPFLVFQSINAPFTDLRWIVTYIVAGVVPFHVALPYPISQCLPRKKSCCRFLMFARLLQALPRVYDFVVANLLKSTSVQLINSLNVVDVVPLHRPQHSIGCSNSTLHKLTQSPTRVSTSFDERFSKHPSSTSASCPPVYVPRHLASLHRDDGYVG